MSMKCTNHLPGYIKETLIKILFFFSFTFVNLVLAQFLD